MERNHSYYYANISLKSLKWRGTLSVEGRLCPTSAKERKQPCPYQATSPYLMIIKT
jgi:hypothetical protein